MKIVQKIILSLCLLLSNQFYSQEIDRDLLAELYTRSLNRSFSLILSSGYKYFEPTEITEQVKSNFVGSTLKFPNDKQLFRLALNDKNICVLRCIHKMISQDTIDVNIGRIGYKAKRGVYFRNGLHFKKIEISIPCSGTDGYIPDFRYAYNPEKRIWENIELK